MRVLLLILLITSFLFAKDWNIVCKGESQSKEMSNFDPPDVLADYDETGTYYYPPYYSLEYIDEDSAACGGHLNANIYMLASCDRENDICDDYGIGKRGFPLIEYNLDEDYYYNNTTFVNSRPCLPTDLATHSLGIILVGNVTPPEVPYSYAHSTHHTVDANYPLTEEVAKAQRSICKKTPAPDEDGKDYSAQLDSIIDNTSENKNLLAINQRDEKLDNDLTAYVEGLTPEIDNEVSMTDFQSTYELTLDDSFEAYSDVFGFGEYGSAPAPISFDFLGKSYEVFNINIIESHVDMIRNTFAIFAYLWGIIIVFRGV